MTVTDRGWTNTDGEHVVFRVAVNPVIRTQRRNPDGTRAGTALKGIVAPDDITDWLTHRLDGSLHGITVINHFRDTYDIPGRGSNPTRARRLVIDTIDATATVTDAASLDTLRRNGLGRSRAYGCGLLTAHPAADHA